MKRSFYAAVFFVLLITEIIIGAFATGFIRNNLGDVLVVCVIYFFICIFTDKCHYTLPLMIFIFACCVELLQYIDICGLLSIPKDSLLAVIIGTNGNIPDIFAYLAGMAIIYVYLRIENVYNKRRCNYEHQ